MSAPFERLPDSVMIDGVNYPIHTGFRIWIQFESIMLSQEDFSLKTLEVINLCYADKLPLTIDGALTALINFYAGNPQKSNGGEKSSAPIYSFDHDYDYIYAAFLSQYGIDLYTADMHWWKFKALFKSLNDTNMIIKIMEYRSMEISKIKDREQKSFYRRMKTLYKLPDLRTEAQKEKAMIDSLSKFF